MKKVLVPLDGSSLSDGIVPHVGRLLGDELHEVVLLRVLTSPELREVAPGEPAVHVDEVREHLALVGRDLEGRGASVSVSVRVGDPAVEILAAIQELAPDLVAMTSHGRSGVSRFVRGSVAEQVVRGSPVPVLLVTAKTLDTPLEHRLTRILVPLDGSERSAAILPFVEDLAREHGAEVVLARVEWEGLSRPLLASTLSTDNLVESLRPFQERLVRDGIPVRTVAAHGDFANEILGLADSLHSDLIAMTTHGRSGWSRFLDGSVSEQVLRHCHRPLLVVRTP